MLAASIPISNGQMEFRHQRQSVESPDKSSSWTNFAVRSFNMELRGILDRSCITLADSIGEPEAASQVDEQGARREALITRGRHALQIFHSKCRARDVLAGEKFNPASSQYWLRVKQEWAIDLRDHNGRGFRTELV